MNKKCKKILSFILSLTMVLTCMLQVTPLQVNAAVRANFALNKPVTASHDDGHVPENAVDGDLGTRWGADPYGTNQWIRVDLEAETTFDEFLVASENSAAQKMKKFKIEGSHDDASYEMIYDSETKDAGFDLSLTINLNAAVTYRYVRITVESLITGAYPSVSLREFQVIGDEPTNITDVNEAVDKISIPSKIFKAFEIPSEDSELGVTFTWEALNDKIEISNGQVVPIAKGSSGIRLTASKDGYEKSRTFDFIVYDNEAQDYDIYPVVQQMAYGTGVLGLSDNINIVMDGNTPDYVKNYAQKVLSEYQYTTAVSADKSDSDVNLLVGLAGDMGLADTYFNGVSYDKAISTDIDEGYVLSVSAENNTIAILGKDASGMYNGLSTLSQMLESSRSQLKDVLIEDAPDTLFRGIVEGFYGEYSFSERKDLIQFIGPLKMNTYVYGAKSDPYHRNQWRDLYPDETLAQLKELVDCAIANNVELVWTAHVGGNIDMSSEDDYNAIVNKFDQLYSIGVRQFGIFYDDAYTDNTYLTDFINKLNQNYIHEKGDVKSLIICPQSYCKTRADESWFTKMAAFDADVQVMWTGDGVISEITPSMMEYIESKINRKAYIWWNYPVNDLGMGNQLLVGETVGLSTEMGSMNGLVSNPMLQAQASKFSLFSIADYGWNIAGYDQHKSWDAAVDYIIPEEEYAEAFKLFSANNNQSVAELQDIAVESEYLIDDFEAFKETFYADGDYKEKAEALKEEFKKIEDACEFLRTYPNNTDLISQIKPWMDQLEPIAAAGQKVMDNIIRIYDGSLYSEEYFTNAWQNYLDCRSTLGNIGGKWSGRRELIPFLQEMQSAIHQKLLQSLGDVDYVRTMTNYRDGNYAMMGLDEIVDGNDVTGIALSQNETAGKWFGVDLGRTTEVSEIEVLLGSDDSDSNTGTYQLQVSDDAVTWSDIESTRNGNTVICTTPVSTRFVRLNAVQGCSKQVTVREFYVNRTDRTVYTNTDIELSVSKTNTSVTLDRKDSVTLKPGEYIGIRFDNAKKIPGIDYTGALTLEYSDNELTWNEYSEGEVTARFVRVVNKTDRDQEESFGGLTVQLSDAKIPENITVSEINLVTWSGNKDQLVDGNRSTYHWTRTQTAGNGYILDLNESIKLYDITAVMGSGDYMEGGVVEISDDQSTWTEVGTIAGQKVTTVNAGGQQARYIRIRITQDSGNWLQFAEVEINHLASSTEALVIDDGADAVIDSDLSTALTAGSGSFIFNNYQMPVASALNIVKDSTTQLTAEALVDGEWTELSGEGTTLVKYDLSMYSIIPQFRITYSQNAGIYELALQKVSFDELEKEVNAYTDLDESLYTESSWKALQDAINQGKELLNDETVSQSDINEAVAAIKDAAAKLEFKGADYTKVDEAIAKAEALNKDSYKNFSIVEDAVNAVDRNKKITEQNEVDAMAAAIEDAIAKLEFKGADYTKVDEAIAKANALNKDNYKDFSAVESAVSAVVRDKNITEQSEVDAMAAAIEDAIAGLELKDADYTKVDEAIAKANALNKDNYKDLSAVESAVNAVDRNKKITEQNEVDAMAAAIEDAIAKLEFKGADYTKVDEAIAKVNALNKENYKDFSAVESAVNAVVRDKNITEQSEVDAMAAAIEDAIAGLELKDADYTKVDEAIAKANALNKDNYKDLSAVESAVSAVVRDKKITEQNEVDAMAAAIENAIAKLELKDADYSKVDEAIAKIGALNKEIYSNFSVVENAVNAVVRDKNITEQSEVDAMAAAIEDAIAKLELKGADYAKVDEAIAKAEALDKEMFIDFSAVEDAIKAVVRGKDITKQSEVDAMAQAIEDAISGLKKNSLLYDDVHEGDWFYEYVYDVYVKDLMTGLEETVFAPNNNLVRAQFAVILYRMEGEPEVTFKDTFPDVKDGNFYSDAVIWASDNGIVTGYTATGLFGPNDPITREQMAAMMFRYANYKKLDTTASKDISSFPDGDKVQKFAVDAVKWCVAEEIITGKGEEPKVLDPQGNTVRAEAATIISRYTEIDK